MGVELSRPKNVAIAAGAAAVVFAAPVLALPAAIGGAGLAGYGAGAASTTFDRPNATWFERGEAAATMGVAALGLLTAGWVARSRSGAPAASSVEVGAVESAGGAAAVLRGASSTLVPGGGLAAHEAAGGHALARHVGQTDGALLARLRAQPGISGASTFSSRAVAETSIADVLEANASEIQAWLGGTGGKLVLTGRSTMPVGRYVSQGAEPVSDVSGVTVVLRRDPTLSIGYRIQTGFPTP